MRELKVIKYIAGDGTDTNRTVYETENGVQVRDIIIDAGIGEEVTIGHLSDMHYNICNEKDFEENDPALMSTYENRVWLKDGESVRAGRNCMDLLEDMDQMVFNGDILDYLSWGSLELVKKEVWDRFPDALVNAASHDFARRMQGKVDNALPREELERRLLTIWKHDLYYASKVVKDKVLVVAINNNVGVYNAYSRDCLKKDLELAREKGYVVLLFQHEQMRTCSEKETNVTAEDYITIGDPNPNGLSVNYCEGYNLINGAPFCGHESKGEESNEVFQLILNNADIIKGVFAGHIHKDLNLEIVGKDKDGQSCIIPQYIHTATAYDEGHMMRICVR